MAIKDAKQRKLRARMVEFDSDVETEAEWSARYDARLLEQREKKEKEDDEL